MEREGARDETAKVARRTILKAGFAVAVAGVAGGGLVGCTTGSHPTTPVAASTPDDAASSPAQPPTDTPATSTPVASTTSASPAESTLASASPSSTQSAAHPSDVVTPGSPALEIVHGPSSATGVALTFHGAGDVALATKLLNELEAAGARATVLAVGQWLDQQPAMAKRILAGGHELGNHTYRHLTMPPLTETVDESEITRCADVLRRLTGTAGRWFRPSGTVHATPAILEAAGRAGYATSLSYDVDPADYADPGAAAVTSRVLSAVRSGSIVSLHLGHLGTVQAMPAILDGLRSRGLAAVTMSELMG